jgi:multidrug efflux pump subunit AcrB
MKLAERSLQNPAAVAAAAAIVVLFGVLALLRLPIQLLPDTRQPQLFVNAEWREAAPAELEEALIEPIEEAMRGLPGLVEMTSESNRGRGGVQLTFEVGTDMTRVMLDVVSRLNTLPPLPPDAEEPQVFGGDNFQTQNAASLLIRPIEGHTVPDIAVQYQQLMEEVVEPRLARVPGVSRVNLEGGRPREVQVTFDPHQLAALGLSPQRIADTVIAARDVSAGFANVGRRQFTVRVTGREPVADLGNLVVGWSDDRPLYLRDVADIRTEHVDAFWFSYRSGVPAYYVTLQRTSDSNTVEVVDGIKAAIAELNAGPLAKEKLYADLSWDASVYVRRAIGFVQESLAIGILLAVGGLWYFLRGPRALLVIGASIPISLFFAVITMQLLGRTLNVVSLAGLAFSTGIVIDAALIVQGNVLRFLQEGRSAWEATVEGATEVLPALLASMLTSVAIFLPILFMEGLEGQLFQDLAITMSVSHAASLLVAMTVIPAANRWALAKGIPADQHAHWWRAMTGFAMRLTGTATARLGWIAGITVASALVVWLLAPKVDYLPVAQTDMIWNNMRLPPGGNIETARAELAPVVIERLRPYLEGTKQPKVKYYNFSAFGGFGGTAVVYPEDPRDIPEMVRLLREEIMVGFPDTQVFTQRGSLLSVDGDNSREIRLDFQGADLTALMDAARIASEEIPSALPGTFPQVFPGLDSTSPNCSSCRTNGASPDRA